MGINTCYPYVEHVKPHTNNSLPTYRDKRKTGVLIAEPTSMSTHIIHIDCQYLPRERILHVALEPFIFWVTQPYLISEQPTRSSPEQSACFQA